EVATGVQPPDALGPGTAGDAQPVDEPEHGRQDRADEPGRDVPVPDEPERRRAAEQVDGVEHGCGEQQPEREHHQHGMDRVPEHPGGTVMALHVSALPRCRLGVPATGHVFGVAHVEQVVNATPDRVFEVLADGWTYSDWVVGTAHIRDVDPDWPAPG